MKIIIVFLASIVLCGCTQNVYEDKSNDFLVGTKKEIEVYSDLTWENIIDVVNTDIKITSTKNIDSTKLGYQEIEVYYTYKNKKYVYKYGLNVVDTTPPVVFSGTNKTVNLDYQGDLCNLITYGDNYTGNVKCSITGYYDLLKEGSYDLEYSLKDDSNNEKIVKVKLNVVAKTTNNNTSTNVPKKEFKDIYAAHKNENTEIGIDVSKWQEKIDFQKVKEAGATFVMIRLGVQGAKTREVNIDEYFKENIQNAKEAGLKVGVYFYSIATSKEEALSQAKWVLSILNKEALDLPVVFDWESWASWNSFKISFYQINEIANTFMQAIEAGGYDAMLYSSKFYLEKIWTNKLNYSVWLAHYIDKTTYDKDYEIWQLCNNGHIDGIKGDVDIDILYKK